MKTQRINACPKCGVAVPPDAPQGLCPQCVLAAAAAPEVASTATSQIPSIERLAAAFPQLQILELIGRGGMGFVFKARQPQLDRFVALKLLPDSLAHDAHFAERFNREGRTLARLNHPNIVSIFDFGHTAGAPVSDPAVGAAPGGRAGSETGFYYLMMEYVDGVNLRQAMQAGRFSPAEALAIVPKICEALQYAHEEGVLHRDIKPENILLDSKGRVKIADFGIAKIVGDDKPDISLTATGAALGTPHYMAPEQFEKPATVDHRADIYSLGVVFYELLTGELPIGRFSPPSQRTPVDPRVDDVVMRTLEKEREKRFQSAGEMKTNVEHLTDVGAGTYQAAPPKTAGAEPQRGPGGTMKIPAERRPTEFPFAYRRAAIAGLLLLALLVSGTAVVNLFLPKTYSAKATLTHTGFDNPSEVSRLLREIVSGPVLDQVITDLDLKSRSSFRSESGPLSNERVMLMLRNRLTVSHMNGTTLCDVLAFSESREEAAELANAVVSAYCAQDKAAAIMERAQASDRPISPRRARNIAFAFVLGIPLAAVGSILFGLWPAWRAKRQPPGGTIGITKENKAPAVPAWSLKAVWGAVLAGVGLLPTVGVAMLMAYLAYLSTSSHGAAIGGWEILLILVAMVPGVAGTFLGWMGLSDIRAHHGKLRGVPLAVFAALAWPLGLLLLATVVAPLGFLLGVARAHNGSIPLISATLLLLVSAGALTFAIWAIYAAARWSANQPAPEKRGRLKWVFLMLVAGGLGFIALATFNQVQRNRAWVEANRDRLPTPAGVPLADTNTTPWIRFTITAVELREEKGARWLAIDYLDDVHGGAEKSFPWENTIPGFTATTRTSEFLGGDPTAPVRHQRIEFQMPDTIRRDQLEQLRNSVARMLARKSFRLELTGEKLLFEMVALKHGWVFVAPPEGEEVPSRAAETATDVVGVFKARIKVLPHLKHSPGQPLAFGPVIELFLPKLTAIDFHSGQVKSVPASLTNLRTTPEKDLAICDWIQRQGLDIAHLGQGEFYSSVLDMKVLTREEWDDFSPAQLAASLRPIGKEVASKFGDKAPFAYTYGFQTRAGRLGLLQISDYTDRQSGVKIRYKLAQVDRTESPKRAADGAGVQTAPPSSLLQFRLIADNADTNSPVDVMIESQGGRQPRRLRVLRPVLMDGSAVAHAGIQLETNGTRTIGIKLTAEGGRRFESITASNIGRQIAIVAGGRVLSAPMIRSAVPGGKLQITGNLSAAEADNLVMELNRKPAGPEFSPVVERSLPRAPEFPPGTICLDLESGTFMTNHTFRANQRGTRDWLRTTGADLHAVGTTNQLCLLQACDLVFIEAPATAWDSMPAAEVGWNGTLTREAAKPDALLVTGPGLPDTFLFQTRENGFGLLQILPATNPAPEVKIRYKLVRDASAK